MSLYFLRLDPAENLLTPRWGHIRPAQGFILNLLRLHPTLHITFLISGIVGLKAAKDKLRYNVSPDIEARLRTIHLTTGPKEGAALTSSMEYVQGLGALIGGFEETFTRILKVSHVKIAVRRR